MMGLFLMVLGFGWAIIGVANLATGLANEIGEGMLVLSFVVNAALFMLPGVIVGAIGARMRQSARRAAEREVGESARIEAAVQAAIAEERRKAPPSP